MAKYLVLDKSFINNSIVEADTEVEYDGEPSANLKPLDEAAKAAAKKAGLTVTDDVPAAPATDTDGALT